MNPREFHRLVQRLDGDLTWRRRELTTLKFMVDGGVSDQRSAVLRAAICLLYAHWEGYVREAATAYVRSVASLDLKLGDVSTHFVALALRSEIRQAGQTRKATLHTNLANKFLHGQDEIFRPNWRKAVDTDSNLNSDVLADILCLIGIDSTGYAMEQPTLDSRLLKNRNSVAHGQYLAIDYHEYDDIHKKIVDLMGTLRDDIAEAADKDKYLRSASAD